MEHERVMGRWHGEVERSPQYLLPRTGRRRWKVKKMNLRHVGLYADRYHVHQPTHRSIYLLLL